jgi:hypothetical protein
MQRLDFTIEPFIEGHPGRHVTEPVRILESKGVDVEFGAFGSSCIAADEIMPELVAEVVRAAFAHGATHVNLELTEEPSP